MAQGLCLHSDVMVILLHSVAHEAVAEVAVEGQDAGETVATVVMWKVLVVLVL